MAITSELIAADPVRRVVIELPEERALAFSRALNEHVVWNDTEAEEEFNDLFDALGGDWRTAEEAATEKKGAEA